MSASLLADATTAQRMPQPAAPFLNPVEYFQEETNDLFYMGKGMRFFTSIHQSKTTEILGYKKRYMVHAYSMKCGGVSTESPHALVDQVNVQISGSSVSCTGAPNGQLNVDKWKCFESQKSTMH